MADETSDPAARIRRLHGQVGSLDKLAARLGCDRQRIIDWEAGAIPSRRYAEKLAAQPEAIADGLTADSFRVETGASAVRRERVALERQIERAQAVLAALPKR